MQLVFVVHSPAHTLSVGVQLQPLERRIVSIFPPPGRRGRDTWSLRVVLSLPSHADLGPAGAGDPLDSAGSHRGHISRVAHPLIELLGYLGLGMSAFGGRLLSYWELNRSAKRIQVHYGLQAASSTDAYTELL